MDQENGSSLKDILLFSQQKMFDQLRLSHTIITFVDFSSLPFSCQLETAGDIKYAEDKETFYFVVSNNNPNLKFCIILSNFVFFNSKAINTTVYSAFKEYIAFQESQQTTNFQTFTSDSLNSQLELNKWPATKFSSFDRLSFIDAVISYFSSSLSAHEIYISLVKELSFQLILKEVEQQAKTIRNVRK